MASEHVLDIAVRRHVFESQQPFDTVLDGIFDGISQPARDSAGRRLVRLIAGNPVTKGQMTRYVPDEDASAVAERLDAEVLGLLRQATGAPESKSA